VTITLPATESPGVKDLVIQTSDNGDTTFAGAYTYNPAGRIGADGYTSWMNLDVGMNNYVYALETDANGQLYAGGEFTLAGGESANYIAQWDPVAAAWTNLVMGWVATALSLRWRLTPTGISTWEVISPWRAG
jgi:hypothetical protein